MIENWPKSMSCSLAIELQRAEKHLDQQRIANPLADDLPGRLIGQRAVQIVVVDDRGGQLFEVVFFRGKGAVYFAAEEVEIVVELQRHARERDRRANLRHEREIFPVKAELAKQPCQRAFAGPLGREVGHRVQPDVEVATAEPIERVQAPNGRVPLEDADPLVEVRQTNAGGQP
jgi:hypothetical protein